MPPFPTAHRTPPFLLLSPGWVALPPWGASITHLSRVLTMCQTVLILSIPMATWEAGPVIIPILQKRNLRLRGGPQILRRPDLILPLGLTQPAPPAGPRDSAQPTEVCNGTIVQLSPWTPKLLARPPPLFLPDLILPSARVWGLGLLCHPK